MKNKIIYSLLVFMMCFALVGCGSNSSKDAYDENKTYDTIEEIPLPNDYKLYSIEEASKQDWFSQVGALGEKHFYGWTGQGYNVIDADFGYVNDTNLLVPDAIIYQYISHEQDEYKKAKQKVITKDKYISDNGYTFLQNLLPAFGYTDDEIEKIIQNKFTLSMELSEMEKALAEMAGGQEQVDYVSGWHYNHIGPSVGFKFLSTLPADPFTTSFDMIEKTGELARIIQYGILVKGHISRDYRIILVYDDIKANIVITLYYENDDELYNSGKTFYQGNYTYRSDILDKDADNFVRENINKIKR